ncbi:MAG TPA: hypothetical protein VGF86_15580 [Candidatus Tumulicola sp.]|jgi:hypothetical protein
MAPLAPFPEPSPARREAFAALKAGLNQSAGAVPRLAAETVIPSAISTLDRALGGGFPRGALVTLEGNAGRWSLAARLLAQVTRGALAAIVDDGGLYPPGLVRAGVRLDRVLIAPATTALATARAADILLRSRACRLVLMSAPDLRAAVWSRLATLAHRAGVLLIAVVARAAAPLAAAATLRLDCALERLIFHGTRGLWCTFSGYQISMRVRKHQRAGGAAPAHARVRAATALDGAVERERTVTREPSSAFENYAHATVH